MTDDSARSTEAGEWTCGEEQGTLLGGSACAGGGPPGQVPVKTGRARSPGRSHPRAQGVDSALTPSSRGTFLKGSLVTHAWRLGPGGSRGLAGTHRVLALGQCTELQQNATDWVARKHCARLLASWGCRGLLLSSASAEVSCEVSLRAHLAKRVACSWASAQEAIGPPRAQASRPACFWVPSSTTSLGPASPWELGGHHALPSPSRPASPSSCLRTLRPRDVV